MTPFRLSEWLHGSVRILVQKDEQHQVLKNLTARKIPLWNVRELAGSRYGFSVGLTDLKEVIAVARKAHVSLRFIDKKGWPFWLWHAQRRKTFLVGGIFFIVILYMLSSFVWHVDITGTDQPEEVEMALKKIHIYPGGWLYRIMQQDEVQLALLEQMPNISWVGVKIQGTSVFVKVIPRIAPAEQKPTSPQEIVASVPGVVANALAVKGKVMVTPGEYVTPGTLLIAGALDNGITVRADGQVEGIVWYRTELTFPLKVMLEEYTGRKVQHDYLVIAGFPLLVWGFSHPPFQIENTVSSEQPLRLGPFPLPISWRENTVYEVTRSTKQLAQGEMQKRGLEFVKAEVLRGTLPTTKVIRQNILQHKVEHGNLYMTVWTEVLEDIGKAQAIAPRQPTSIGN